MGAFKRSRSEESFDTWIKNASSKELEEAYETRRLQWIKDGQGGTGEKTPEMQKLDREISARAAEAWKNNPKRNTDPNYRWTDANRWEKD